jgi:ABC-type antimicrobial peptide transport system permease subunit
MDAQTATARFGSFVLTTFALLALTLASVGLYGVITFLVNSRRRDIAVRIALGANRSSILQLIMRQGMIVAAAGVLVGGVAALLSARFLSAFLYQVQPSDPRTIATSIFILLAIATLANLIPALRAARTQPEAVLRAE